jgi:hypothetical protein
MRGHYILGFLAVVFFAVAAFGSVVLIGLREGASPSPYTVALFALGIIALIINRSHRNSENRHSPNERHS